MSGERPSNPGSGRLMPCFCSTLDCPPGSWPMRFDIRWVNINPSFCAMQDFFRAGLPRYAIVGNKPHRHRKPMLHNAFLAMSEDARLDPPGLREGKPLRKNPK